MKNEIFWTIFYGVDASHMVETLGSFDTFEEGERAYNDLDLKYPLTIKRMYRVAENETPRCTTVLTNEERDTKGERLRALYNSVRQVISNDEVKNAYQLR